jgi:hypothetical protein
MNALKEKLDVSERTKFRKLQAIIAEGISSFVVVGNALKEIRDSKLYREEYKTFEKYVSDKWKMQKSQAYRLIDSSVINQNLSHIVGQSSRVSEIVNPRQLCELKDVPAESMAPVVERAAAIAGKDKITASDLKQARQEVLGEVAVPDNDLIFRDVDDDDLPVASTPKKPHVSHNSGENEWYTPQPFVESARSVLGSIDLDPASSEVANRTVQAAKIHSLDDDGLTQKWNGRVWMNPPYASNLIGAFAEKLVDHVSDGSVPTAIVLVNNATETKWFQTLLSRANAVCFPLTRIRFISPDGNSGSPLQGQALVYFGDEVQRFRSEFSKFGFCLDVRPSIENAQA